MPGMIAVDIGGTFTDVVAVVDGDVFTAKLPTDYEHMERPVLEGAERMGIAGASVLNHASTAGLNAVITRNLPKTGFLTTFGHRDLLDMGRARRPPEGLTDPSWRRSFGDVTAPLVPRYLRRGVIERVLSDGSVLVPLDREQALREIEVLGRCGVEGVAICLLHSYANPEHELQLQSLVADALGDIPCSVSSVVSPLIKEYPRASTTLIELLMQLILRDYHRALKDGLEASGFSEALNFADCAATLVPADRALEQAHRLIFSGPAGGTVASAHFSANTGNANLICCDVGGTSTDISIVKDGAPLLSTSFEVEPDLIINALNNEIHTLGAGGGSIVQIGTAGEMRVGPASAGSWPGPACYGRGGEEPTLTDACLLLGFLDSASPLGGTIELDATRSHEAFSQLPTEIPQEDRARYAFQLALDHIAEGILDVTIRNGVDPRFFTIVAYGAAGPMLVPNVLSRVKARRVMVPPHPGLFSALGLLSTDLVFTESRSKYLLLEPTSEVADELHAIFAELEKRVRGDATSGHESVIRRTFDGHFDGQSWDTPFVSVPEGPIDAESIEKMVSAFRTGYAHRWGNSFDGLDVVAVTYRVQLVVPSEKVAYPETDVGEGDSSTPTPIRATSMPYYGPSELVAEYRRSGLRRGHRISGPALIREDNATIHVPLGCTATVGRHGEVVIELCEQ